MAFVYSGTFEILAPPSITVNTPSSAPYFVTDVVNITWSSTGTVGNVKIDLYKFSTHIQQIVSSTNNDGSYNWTVKTNDLAGSSSYYRIRVQETDGSPSAFSGYFRINSRREDSIIDAISVSESFSDSITQYKTVKTASDSSQFSESISSSEQLWKHIKTASDSSQFTENISSFVVSQPEPTDNISVSETLSTTNTSWKYFNSPSDNAAVSETLSTFIHKQPEVSDGILTSESVSSAKSQWKKVASDQSIFSENFDYNLGFNYNISDNTEFTESVVAATAFWKHLKNVTDNLNITETIAADTRQYKKLSLISDASQFSVDNLAYNIGSWENNLSSDASAYTEVIAQDTRVWKQNFDCLDSTSTTETVSKTTRVWKHLTTASDETEFTQSVATETKPWKRFATDEAATTESVQHTISQWAYAVNEVISFTENVSDVFGEAAIDAVAFVESINSQIFRNSNIRKFQDNSTENFNTLHRTGWISTDEKEGKSKVIRRLNIEYNSADPIDVSIYVNGDDQNQEFNTSFAADTSEETTNKSIRVGRRAKNFMLELSTPTSTNTNVTIEDLEIEIDDGKN